MARKKKRAAPASVDFMLDFDEASQSQLPALEILLAMKSSNVSARFYQNSADN